MNEAQQQLERLLAQAATPTPHFAASSRYSGIELATLATVDGRSIRYLRRRFVPPPEAFALVREHTVVQGDRLDLLAARYLEDPELFWRLCDANGVVRPEELTEAIGRALRITLPHGIPGAAHD